MMNPGFLSKLSQVIGVPAEKITDETALGVEDWDSIGMLELIAAMDQAYGVTLSAGAINSSGTVGNLLSLLRTSGANV